MCSHLNAESEGVTGPVTLSEGGISFLRPQPLEVGQPLALRLRLKDGAALLCRGQVIYSQAQTDNRFRLGVQFIELDAQARDRIVRRMLAVQGLQRRQAKRRLG
nr:PilZ domain-containing protein [Motiliproteus sp. SC1-56]